MNVNFVMIDEENREIFDSVFPNSIEMTPNRAALAAHDEDGVIVGAISFAKKNMRFDIDWIYVEPELRRQGIGTSLVNEVIRLAMHTDEMFPVTAQFECGDDDTMHTFFLSNNAMETEYSHEKYYVEPEELKSIKDISADPAKSVELKKFFDIPMMEQFGILNMLAEKQFYSVNDYETWSSECVHELCQCAYINNNLVNLLFMRKLPDGNLELSYLYGKNSKGLVKLLKDTVSKMEMHFSRSLITFDTVSAESRKMADHLFPNAKTVHIYEAVF